MANLTNALVACTSLCYTLFYLCFSFCVWPIILIILFTLLPTLPTIVDTIGDILGSSSAIIVDSSVSSVTISLTNSYYNLTADVYLSSIKPSENTEYLPHTTLTNSSFSSSISINYLGADNPIYLLPGSKLSYNVSISSFTNTSKCPGRLHLFNDIINYLASSDAILSSPCLSVESPTLWTVNITDSSSYYVRIEKNDEVNVTSVISVVRVYYNTTGLKAPDECSLLTNDKSSCNVTTCGSICTKQDQYIIVKPTDNVVIQYEFTPSTVNRGNLTAFEGVFGSLFVSLFCCFACMACACCALLCSKEDKDTPRLREEIQTSNNSVNNEDVTNFHPRVFNVQELYQQFDDTSSTSSSETDCSESTSLLQNKQQTSHIKESHGDPPYLMEKLSSSSSLIKESSFLNTSSLQNESSFIDDTVSLSVDHSNKDSLSSVLLTLENIQYDNVAKQDQAPAFCSDHKKKYITTSSEENKVSNHPKTDVTPDFQIMKAVFENLSVLEVTTTGLVHHCSQYGVTLVIPEGAIEHTATVWFGMTLLSDKFKFKDDFIPVSPIVWTYINCQLLKPAELYIPHHIADVSNMKGSENQLYLLTADDESFTRNGMFSFKQNHETRVIIESTLIKILAFHFCSNCVATTSNSHRKIPKRYLIARADKKVDDDVFVEFSFLYQQPGCMKTLQEQCRKEGYTLSHCLPVTFSESGQVSLSFQPESIPDWKWSYIGFCYDYISEDSIDYYKMMGCEGGEVTSDNIKILEILEDFLSYPPRFRLQFNVQDDVIDARSQNVKVRFNGVHPPTTVTIVLEKADSKHLSLPLTPTLSSSSSSPDLSLTDARFFSKETDPFFGEILKIITIKDHLKGTWFYLGYELGLTVGELEDIEIKYHESLQRTRNVLLQWKVNNKNSSWDPLIKALHKIGLTEVAFEVECQFTAQEKPQTPVEVDGIYCSLCNKYHGINSYHSQDVIPYDKLQAVPSIADLNNFIGAKIEDKYHLFGVAVGLEESYLNSLRIDYPTCQERFNQVFNKWSQTNPDSFTWGTVINVLQSDTIKAHKVVEIITDYLTSC